MQFRNADCRPGNLNAGELNYVLDNWKRRCPPRRQLSVQQIRNLKQFIRAKERSVTPYYAGRSEILADIEARVNLMWKRQEANGTRA